MKIVVCVKQVPFIGDLRFDGERGVLVRAGVTNVLNAFDRPGVVAAVELACEQGGEVIAVTQGPPDARVALREALALGAGRAVHLRDPAFAGSDTLATARALAAAIRREGAVDLVLLGQRSTDADTALVGPLLAGFLDLPLIAGVTACHLSEDGRTLTAKRETETGPETLAVTLPALLTAAERLRPAVALAPEAKAAADAKPLNIVKPADLNLSPAQVGAAGSATRVLATRLVARQRAGAIISGDDPVAAAETLARELVRRGIFDAGQDVPAPEETFPSPASSRATGAIWAVLAPDDLLGPSGAAVLELIRRAARAGGAAFPSDASAEALPGQRTAGARPPATATESGRHGGSTSLPKNAAPGTGTSPAVAATTNDGAAGPTGLVAEVILSGPANPVSIERLTSLGIQRIRVPADATAPLDAAAMTAYLAVAFERERPLLVLLPATDAGREVAGRVAAAHDLGIVSDCLQINWDAAGRPVLLRPALGGDRLVSVGGQTRPLLATVSHQRWLPDAMLADQTESRAAPNRADAPPHSPEGSSTSAALDTYDIPPIASRVRVLHAAPPAGRFGPRIATARVVIGVGRGVGPPENHAPIEELADVMGGVIGATRKVTDAGWLPRERQIGLTGQAIAPRFYLAIAIRGLSHHAVGIRQAETIAVINDNPNAPIWALADLGVVGDWTQIVPALTAALRRLRPPAG